jgi:hypothetical protein
MAGHGDDNSAIGKFLAGLGTFLTHRWLITVFNLATAYVVVVLFRHFAGAFDGAHAHNHELSEALTGVGVVLIGWGVALEERHALRHIFRMPNLEAPEETRIDDLCHYYGVGLLLMGLFSEMLVEFVKLPNEIVNTDGIEHFVLGASAVMLGAGLVMLITFSWSLIRGKA